jgi:hypothetical protein
LLRHRFRSETVRTGPSGRDLISARERGHPPAGLRRADRSHACGSSLENRSASFSK